MKLDTELVNIRINSKQSIEEFETIFMDKVGQYKMAVGLLSQMDKLRIGICKLLVIGAI